MKARVYIETTIPSYLAARLNSDPLIAFRQQLTLDWWKLRAPEFDLFVSEPVLQEAAAGNPAIARKRLAVLQDIPVLALNGSILELAGFLVAGGAMPRNAAGDALHVAIATVYGCEYLLTWNCRHLANAQFQRAARSIALRSGFDLPVICTPEELMEDWT